MENIILQIESLVKQLTTLMPISEENQKKLDKKIRLEFNYNSNHLEGNTLTFGETELLLIFDKTTGNHDYREYEEMKFHDFAFDLIKEWSKENERPINEKDLKDLHKILLVKPFWKEAITYDGQSTRRLIKVGDYKDQPNSVRLQNGEIFNFASPQETPILMNELFTWYREEEPKNELHPVALAALLHYKFVRIHPFDDGNGRISRLLMNYVLIKHNFPPAIIKSADKKNYLFALNQADTGNLQAFVEYICHQLIWSIELYIKATKGESLEEDEDWRKKLTIFKKNIGQGNNLKIEQRYNSENLNNVYEKTLKPLTKKWELRLEEFDLLFFNRKCFLGIILNDYSNPNYDLEGIELFNLLTSAWGVIHQNFLIYELHLSSRYSLLKDSDKQKDFNAGYVSFYFYDNGYKINFKNILPDKNFLYDEYLSEEDIKNIIDTFSRNLTNAIGD